MIKKTEKGFAMVLALVLLLAMSLMGGALILIASGDHQSNNDSDQYQQTFYAAEMGLLEGERYLLNQKNGPWNNATNARDLTKSNLPEKNTTKFIGEMSQKYYTKKSNFDYKINSTKKITKQFLDTSKICFNSFKDIDRDNFHVIKDATDIKEKYIQTGTTIDLGIMYIPSESLMQLIDSIDNLREQIFRDSRVLIMGPNSLAAYLISVHMGFRTLALNERASEIMEEFGKLKKEFEKFGSSTDDLIKKADAMLKSVNEHATRERQMGKAIKNMDQLDS